MSQTEDTLNRLRKELADAQKLGVTEGATSGAFQQLTLQMIQECDRRRAECVRQAESLRTQAAAAEAQSHAFSVIGSIVCAIVHGFNANAQKALDDEAARDKEKSDREMEEAALPTTTSESSDETPEAEAATGKPKKPPAKKK